jgi:hypothetical protein
MLPSPKARYMQYCANKLTRWTEKKVQRILKLMLTRELLSEADYAVAAATPLVFDRTEALPERACRLMVKTAIETAPSTSPLEQQEAAGGEPTGDDDGDDA